MFGACCRKVVELCNARGASFLQFLVALLMCLAAALLASAQAVFGWYWGPLPYSKSFFTVVENRPLPICPSAISIVDIVAPANLQRGGRHAPVAHHSRDHAPRGGAALMRPVGAGPSRAWQCSLAAALAAIRGGDQTVIFRC